MGHVFNNVNGVKLEKFNRNKKIVEESIRNSPILSTNMRDKMCKHFKRKGDVCKACAKYPHCMEN